MTAIAASHNEIERFLGVLFASVVTLPDGTVYREPWKPEMSFDDMAAALGVCRQQAEREFWRALRQFFFACYRDKCAIDTQERLEALLSALPVEATASQQLRLIAVQRPARSVLRVCANDEQEHGEQLSLLGVYDGLE